MVTWFSDLTRAPTTSFLAVLQLQTLVKVPSLAPLLSFILSLFFFSSCYFLSLSSSSPFSFFLFSLFLPTSIIIPHFVLPTVAEWSQLDGWMNEGGGLPSPCIPFGYGPEAFKYRHRFQLFKLIKNLLKVWINITFLEKNYINTKNWTLHKFIPIFNHDFSFWFMTLRFIAKIQKWIFTKFVNQIYENTDLRDRLQNNDMLQ